MKKQVQLVQEQLKKRGLDVGPVDGIIGTKTLKALDSVEEIPSEWSNKRKIIGFIQLLCKEKKIEAGPIDGYWGPQTDNAFESLEYFLKNEKLPPPWRDIELAEEVNPNDWPKDNEDELMGFYGEVGENQTRIQLPYPHKLAWNKRVVINRFSCHEKVHDSLLKILTRVFEHYGIDEIKKLRLDLWGGCLNVRSKRGGSTPSVHSWGVAVDYDPEKNNLKWGRDRAAFAKPEYDMWWKFWEDEGWVSLGREKNYDWMHVQAVKL